MISDSAPKIKKGIYKHYKGNLYQVLDIALHSETEEELVIYKHADGTGSLWARPLSMFLEFVNINEKIVERFKYLGNENN